MKNWTTIFKSVKKGQNGLINYSNYLRNDNHDNHNDQNHKIINFQNKQEQNERLKNMIRLVQEKQLEKKFTGKVGGGSIRKFGHSITLNLPFEVEDPKKLKLLTTSILNSFISKINKLENLNISQKDYDNYSKNRVFYNVHQKDTGSKTQLNYILSEYLKDNVKIDLSKKKYSYLFKKVSNEKVKEILGIDILDYEFENNPKQQKKQNQDFYKYKQELDSIRKQYLNLLDDLEEKVSKRLNNYLTRMEKSIEEMDKDKFEKNKKYIEKNLKEIKSTKKITKMTKSPKHWDVDI